MVEYTWLTVEQLALFREEEERLRRKE